MSQPTGADLLASYEAKVDDLRRETLRSSALFAPICCECAFATPEQRAQTKAAFGALLDAAEAMSPTGTSVIGAGHSDGPDPFDARIIDPNAEATNG